MTDSVWKVVYAIHSPIALGGGSVSFAAEGVTIVEKDGSMFRIEHTLQLPEAASMSDALTSSEAIVEPLLVAIRFLRLTPVDWSADAIRLSPPGSNLLAFGLSASVIVGPRPLTIPPQGWNGQDSDRLATWLSFASEAQEPSSLATGIRLYALIVEDWKVSNQLDSAQLKFAEELAAVRDFVSHPEIKYPGTQQRLRSCAPKLTTGPDAFRYRPTNPDHREELVRVRERARDLVDSELFKRLGVTRP